MAAVASISNILADFAYLQEETAKIGIVRTIPNWAKPPLPIDYVWGRNEKYSTMSSNPTIFIVDDDEAVRESLKALVQSNGLAAEAYGSGEEFLKAHNASRHGCVLLDIQMPGMTGLEVLATLKSNDIDTPVILITGGAHPGDRKVRLAGAIALLGKPLCSRPLMDAIGRALEQS